MYIKQTRFWRTQPQKVKHIASWTDIVNPPPPNSRMYITRVHMHGPTAYPNARGCILQHAATGHGAHLTYAMNLGSVQCSPARGSTAICRAHASHTVHQTPHSPPSTTSSHKKPWRRPHNHGHYNIENIRLVKKYKIWRQNVEQGGSFFHLLLLLRTGRLLHWPLLCISILRQLCQGRRHSILLQ